MPMAVVLRQACMHGNFAFRFTTFSMILFTCPLMASCSFKFGPAYFDDSVAHLSSIFTADHIIEQRKRDGCMDVFGSNTYFG